MFEDPLDEDMRATYRGEWLEVNYTRYRQGFGVLERADGSRYEGYFKRNQFDGKGKLTFAIQTPQQVVPPPRVDP